MNISFNIVIQEIPVTDCTQIQTQKKKGRFGNCCMKKLTKNEQTDTEFQDNKEKSKYNERDQKEKRKRKKALQEKTENRRNIRT